MTEFGSSEPFTLGVEEEFQILDPQTGELVSRIDEVMGKAEPAIEENLQSELFQALVETTSDICADIDELREDVSRLRGALIDTMADKGYTIAAAGTHPFALWEEQDYTDRPRYDELIDDVQWPAKRELIFGQHTHVAVENAPQAIYVNNGLRPFLPILLALSSNSPFWRGVSTGLKSTRVRIFDALPRTGIPREFSSFADFQAALDTLAAGGSIEDVTKIWWDVRPRPDIGTVEVRIPDLPTTVDESIAVAALTQALVVRLARDFEQGEERPIQHIPEVIDENRWRALRDGLEADLIRVGDDGEVETMSVESAVKDTLALVDDVVQDRGLKEEMATIEEIVQRGETGADRQLRIYEETGEFTEVMSDLVERTPP
jgi:carboxylate-amine ligase